MKQNDDAALADPSSSLFAAPDRCDSNPMISLVQALKTVFTAPWETSSSTETTMIVWLVSGM